VLDPKDLRPKDSKFSVESQKKESCIYWTDLITLTEDTLNKFGPTRSKLGPSNDNNILYAIQDNGKIGDIVQTWVYPECALDERS
jgi:hypothetical protein